MIKDNYKKVAILEINQNYSVKGYEENPSFYTDFKVQMNLEFDISKIFVRGRFYTFDFTLDERKKTITGGYSYLAIKLKEFSKDYIIIQVKNSSSSSTNLYIEDIIAIE